MTDSTPVRDVLTDHSYDGIEEYDNPLPGWWSAIFFLSFVYAFFYLVYYHAGEGPSMQAEYDAHAAEISELRFAELGNLTPDRVTLLQYVDDPKWLSVGRAVFKTHCVSCHGPEGLGGTGPNLTDDHWKNVTRIEDIARVVENGAAGGAMPAWGRRLSHVNQLVLVSAYVASLRGSASKGSGVAPYGDEIPPWGGP